MIRLNTEKQDNSYITVLQTYSNLAPIVDMVVVDLEKQGQGQLVTCSGILYRKILYACSVKSFTFHFCPCENEKLHKHFFFTSHISVENKTQYFLLGNKN